MNLYICYNWSVLARIKDTHGNTATRKYVVIATDFVHAVQDQTGIKLKRLKLELIEVESALITGIAFAFDMDATETVAFTRAELDELWRKDKHNLDNSIYLFPKE